MLTRSRICVRTSDNTRDCERCIVRHVSLCAHVDDSGIERLRAISAEERFLKGSTLLEQDVGCHKVYVVTDGFIKLFRFLVDGHRQVTGFLAPGDLLGSIKRQNNAHCTAEAITDVSACSFDRGRFEQMLRDYPDLCIKLFVVATDEIEAQHEQITLISGSRAEQRLAAFLLSVGQRWQIEDHGQPVIPLPIARADIADYLGLTVESVSRAFRRLTRLGYIDLPRPSRVLIRNAAALTHLSGLETLPHERVTIGL